MNFFEQQDRAHQNTSLLLGLFGLSVATMTGCIYMVAIAASNLSHHSVQVRCPQPSITESTPYNDPDLDRLYRRQNSKSTDPTSQVGTCDGNKTAFIWWNPQILFWVTLLTTAVVGGASLYKISELKQGGAAVALDLGGRLIVPEMADATERQLLNLVEEMAIAAGIPVPYVFVLQNEDEINAFAAGYTPETAVLGVTRGALTHLTRNELQGVIGHEFSHILNGDMRLNIRLMGLLHGILFVYLAGRALLYTHNRSHAGGVLGLALMAIGSSGVLCGRLIQRAVSRQREFLADAASVQFTRNLEGMTSALAKLAEIGSRLASPQAEAARHIFFGSATGRVWAGGVFATHPPLRARIARLQGTKSHRLRRSDTTTESVTSAIGFSESSDAMSPESVVGQVGTVLPEHYAYTQGLLAQIPETLRTQLRDTQGAIAAIYALFLDPSDEAVYEQQLQRLRTAEIETTLVKAIQIGHDVQSLNPLLRLPLLDLAVPALRTCPLERLEALLKGLQDLAQADDTWTFSEFALFLVLQRRLETHGSPHRTHTDPSVGLEQLWDESLMLLSALASASDTNPNAITYAFRCGVFKLPTAAQETVPEQALDWTLDTVRQSLERLRQAEPKAKQAVVNACAHTVLLDPDVMIAEAELLRAIAIVLDCPIPPFLNALQSTKTRCKPSRTGAG